MLIMHMPFACMTQSDRWNKWLSNIVLKFYGGTLGSSLPIHTIVVPKKVRQFNSRILEFLHYLTQTLVCNEYTITFCFVG